MIAYKYPQVSGGYIWNMLNRIRMAVGFWPAGTSNTEEWVNGTATPENPFPGQVLVKYTVVEFQSELTTTQKAALDAVMADNPTFPPSTGQKNLVKDIYEEFDQFRIDCGIPSMEIFYQEATTGSGKVNRLVLWTPQPITGSQKNAVRTAYNNLWIG